MQIRISALLLLLVSTLGHAQNGGFVQGSFDTGTYSMTSENADHAAYGFDVRMGTFSRAWRDFYRYVGIGAERYYLANPKSIGTPKDGFDPQTRNEISSVFLMGGISLNTPISPFVEIGGHLADWSNGELAQAGHTGRNGFVRAGLDIKSRDDVWLQIYYKLTSLEEVPVKKMVTAGLSVGFGF
jgi:hypothetical protein